jgi:hypothetical protein
MWTTHGSVYFDRDTLVGVHSGSICGVTDRGALCDRSRCEYGGESEGAEELHFRVSVGNGMDSDFSAFLYPSAHTLHHSRSWPKQR